MRTRRKRRGWHGSGRGKRWERGGRRIDWCWGGLCTRLVCRNTKGCAGAEEQQHDPRHIGLVSAQDGSLRLLKSLDWHGAGRMFFSPDGKYLGYDRPESDTSRERDVFVLAI